MTNAEYKRETKKIQEWYDKLEKENKLDLENHAYAIKWDDDNGR